MGVDFYNCNVCGEIYSDHDDGIIDCEECGINFCSSCREKCEIGEDEEGYDYIINCPICNKTEITVRDVKKYIEKKLSMTYEEIKQEALEDLKE